MHLLPKADPIERAAFGGTHQELETISAYQDALRRLQRGPTTHGPSGGGGGAGAPKGEGKGKDKGKDEKDKKGGGDAF